MNRKDLGKIQLVVLIVTVIYMFMPDLFIGPIDDAVIAVIAGIAEAVIAVMRVVSNSNSDTECMTDSHDNYSSFDNYGAY